MEIYLLLSMFLSISALMAYLLERIGFSRIAGYIITGIVLSFFFAESLKANTAFLHFFSEVAITLLVFEIGREIGIEKIRRMNLIPLMILGFEIFFAFFLALLFGTIFKLGIIEIVILAAIASFSSTPIIFKLATDLGLSERARREILMVAIFDDIYAIMILALLPNLRFDGFEPIEFLRLATFSLIVTAILIISGLTVVKKLFVKIVEPNEPGVAIILGSAFLFAIISKSLGLSPALGAFAAGIALSTHPKNSELSEYLRPLREIFLIVFFVSLGTQAGLINFFSPLLLLAPLIVFFRFLAFTSANWLTTGKSLDESLKIGFAASCVGEFGMVITYEATKLGLIGLEFLTLSALSVILGALVSSKLSRRADNYAVKISSAVPKEVKAFVDKISVNIYRIVEGKTSEVVEEAFFRILRNVLILIFTIVTCSSALYISDLLFPAVSVYLSIVIFSSIISIIILIAIKTRKYAEDLCSIFVDKSGINPVFKEVLVSSTFFTLVLLSLGLALLVSGSFLTGLVNRIYKVDIAHFLMIFVISLFLSVILIVYMKVKRVPP